MGNRGSLLIRTLAIAAAVVTFPLVSAHADGDWRHQGHWGGGGWRGGGYRGGFGLYFGGGPSYYYPPPAYYYPPPSCYPPPSYYYPPPPEPYYAQPYYPPAPDYGPQFGFGFNIPLR